MAQLIESFEQRYRLGVTSLDDTHREFAELVNRLGASDKSTFADLFKELEQHTRAHFEAENALMRDTAFPAIAEHTDEHSRVLGEMHQIGNRVTTGNTFLARAYVVQQLPAWFDLHAKTMDSALAAHLKARKVTLG